MNNRIIELSELADQMADDKIQMPGEFHPDWHDVRDHFFVELIIKECTEICNRWNSTPGSKLAGAIKEHFGVE